MNSASLRIVGRSWSATLRHWVLAASASFWAKAVAMGNHAATALAGMGQRIAHEMNPASLPSGVQDFGDGGLQAFMGVGDHQLDTAQAAAGELAQEARPEGLGLRRADIHPQNLAPAVRVDGDRNDDGDGDNTAVPTTSLHVGGVDPQIGPIAFKRPVEESLDLAVDLFAQTRDLALGNAAHAERLDQVVDRAHRDALDVGLLDHGSERLLGHPARLEEAREVGALPQLRDAQFHRSGPRLPATVAVAVALDEPLGGLLAPAGAGQPLHLQLHQAMGGKADHLAQKVGVGGLLYQCAQGHHVVGHRSVLGSGRGFANPTLYRRSTMTAAKPLARYGAIEGRARERFPTAEELHHYPGRDPARSSAPSAPMPREGYRCATTTAVPS